MTNKNIIFTATLVSLILAGCTSRAERMKEEGFSENYIIGFESGCVSGTGSAKGLSASLDKNTELFTNDQDYSTAWTKAFKECKSVEEDRQNKKLLDNNIKEQQRLRARS